MRKILAERRIVAKDQNKVFVERAALRKLSPADAEEKYGLEPGKGNAYVEFDVAEHELRRQLNPRMKLDEWFVIGEVDLRSRDAEAFFNQ